MWIGCPSCGRREVSEFTYRGEVRGLPGPDPQAEFVRTVLRSNVAGPQLEEWHHALGCGRWFSITRNTITDEIDVDPAV